MGTEKNVVLFESADGSVELPVMLDPEREDVWLSRTQLATLFGRDVKTIGKHVANALREELAGSESRTVAKFATVQTEGVREVVRQVEHYNLDMILSVGYRVKSARGVEFRRWATDVLRRYIVAGHAENERRLEQLGQVAKIMARVPESLESRQILDIVQSYTGALDLLDDYDHLCVTAPEGSPVGTVEFRNVSFKYPDASEYVLHDMSFKAERGQTVAFIGSTGSGKSTAINLVPRFYDATEGEVLVDGVNVKEYTLAALHDKIGYVPQRAVMFSGTVESNVAYGEKEGLEFDREKVREAVRIAQGKDFVEKMEGDYSAHIAQGGTNVSGGQKQRLAIARAVCREPEIYIFDDSFSALDYKTDKMLRKALREETANATSLIVAQRIGTIRDADLIVVLDEGNVVGKGTHEELLKTCDVYREIALSQLSEEELGEDIMKEVRTK